MSTTSTDSTALDIVLDVERQLLALLGRSPKLAELPLAPLRDVEDLVRLALGLLRFAKVHRSLRSKRLVSAVRTILGVARARLAIATDGVRVARHDGAELAAELLGLLKTGDQHV